MIDLINTNFRNFSFAFCAFSFWQRNKYCQGIPIDISSLYTLPFSNPNSLIFVGLSGPFNNFAQTALNKMDFDLQCHQPTNFQLPQPYSKNFPVLIKKFGDHSLSKIPELIWLFTSGYHFRNRQEIYPLDANLILI